MRWLYRLMYGGRQSDARSALLATAEALALMGGPRFYIFGVRVPRRLWECFYGPLEFWQDWTKEINEKRASRP